MPRCITGFLLRTLLPNVDYFAVHCRQSGQSVKINFDRAYDGRLCQSASGIVARNSEKNVLLVCSVIHQEVASAFVAEALTV